MTRRTPAQYDWSALEFDETILSKHFASPRRLKIAFVVAHHSTILGTGTGAANSTMYNVWQNREASAHYGVDGNFVRQFVWDADAAWSTANTTGNHAGISIEHANSALAPSWTIAETTWKNGARLAAHLHKTYNLGRPVKDKTLRKHSSFFATACPGPFMNTIWAQYVAEAQRVYDEITGVKPTPAPPVEPPAAVVYDRLDPASYFEGVVGPHVTWLGERLNVWRAAYGLPSLYATGPGPDLGPKDNAGVKWFQETVLEAEGKGADGWPGVVTLRRLGETPAAPNKVAPAKPAVVLRAPNTTAPKSLPSSMVKMFHIGTGDWYPAGDSIVGLEATEALGLHWNDMDSHLTKDLVWVFGHWSDIKRDHYILPAWFTKKYGKSPKIENVLWEDLKQLRTPEKVFRGVSQTFRYVDAAEVFAWLATHPTVNVAMELKGSPAFVDPENFRRLHQLAVASGIDPATRLLVMSQPPWGDAYLLKMFKAAHPYFRTAIQRLGWKKPANYAAMEPYIDYVRSGNWGSKTR